MLISSKNTMMDKLIRHFQTSWSKEIYIKFVMNQQQEFVQLLLVNVIEKKEKMKK
jgi:hypothetical protein